MRQRRRLRILVLVMVSGIVALGLAELGIRIFLVEDGTLLGRPLPPFGAVNGKKQRAWLERNRRYAAGVPNHDCFDRELGWTHRATSSRMKDDFYSNSLAARGRREYPPKPKDGTTRLLCFGDSFTYCEEVSEALR